jgi:hypothetical protein
LWDCPAEFPEGFEPFAGLGREGLFCPGGGFGHPLHSGALLFDIVEKEEGEAWSALSLRVWVCGFRAADLDRRDDAELRFF